MESIVALTEKLMQAQGRERIPLLHNLAFRLHQKDPPKMKTLLDEAMSLSEKYRDDYSRGRTHQLLSIYWGVSGDFLKSLECARQAVAMAERMNDDKALSAMFNNLSIIYSRLGDTESGIEAVRSAIAASERCDNPIEKAKGLQNLALNLRYSGETEEAYRTYSEAAELMEQLGNVSQAAITRINAADTAEEVLRVSEAIEHARAALRMSREAGNRFIESTATAMIARLTGNGELAVQAEGMLRKSLENALEAENTELHLVFLRDLASLMEYMGRYEEALDLTKRFNRLRNDVMERQRNSNLVLIRTEMEFREKEREKEKYRLQALEMEIAKNSAEAANEAKSEFLAMVSHEMRTPMNVTMGMLDILARTGLETRQSEYLKKAQSANDSLARIINDILDYSKMESGMLSFEFAPFSPRKILRNTVSEFVARAEEKHLTLAAEAADDIPETLMGDAQRLAQVIRNLLDNALKFTSEGGASISAGVARRSEDDVTVEIRVSDTGIGIPPEVKEDIFQRFSQLDRSMTRKYGGVGLGLAICHRLVTGMGGDISLESVPGKGAEFICRIPFILPAFESAGANSLEDAAQGIELPVPSPSILVVEDQETIREIVEHYTVAAGMKPVFAENGMEALLKLKEADFDLILMDIQMPVMDGLTTTRRLREMGVRVPVIATTGHSMTGHHKMYLKAGIDDCLAKPFTREALLWMVCKWLSRTPPERPTSDGEGEH